MPVTAKLSRSFYERFGDEIANELVEWFNAVDATYRADLREINELNFQRFDAKLEQRMAELDAKLETRLSEFDAKLETRLSELDAKLETGLSGLDAKLERRLGEQDTKLERGLSGLRTELQEVKASLMRWLFASTVTIIGLMFAMLRL